MLLMQGVVDVLDRVLEKKIKKMETRSSDVLMYVVRVQDNNDGMRQV